MSPDGLYFVLRLAIGAILIWAGLAKAARFRDFVDTVRMVPITPRGASTSLAGVIVASEIAFGSLLFLDIGIEVAGLGAAGLFASFGLATVSSRLGHRSAPCSCFGAQEGDLASWATLTRSAALMLMSLVLWVLSTSPREAIPAGGILPATTLVVALVLIVRYSSLMPTTMRYLRTPAPTSLPPTRRQSFRHVPLEASLRASGQPVPARSLLTLIDPQSTQVDGKP